MSATIGWIILCFSILVSVSSAYSQTNNYERVHALQDLTRIAFGSCNDQNDAQPLWADMAKTNPDLFIWGGDVIYADWEKTYDMKLSYAKQVIHPEYVAFKAKTPIIGVWDDHDYAWNNADGSVITKDFSQKSFLDFLEEPADSIRRLQQGVYTSYDLGTEGRRIKIILLDNRYFKGLDKNYPLLGKSQWEWFEKELMNSKADFHIIMAGLPIFSPLMPYTEEWGEHAVELQRMLELIKKYEPKGALFLSGDKHFASIYEGHGQLEFMSSGMTHVAPKVTWPYIKRKYPNTYFGLNYGLIDIEWVENMPKIRLAVRSQSGKDIFPSSYLWKNKKWEKLPVP